MFSSGPYKKRDALLFTTKMAVGNYFIRVLTLFTWKRMQKWPAVDYLIHLSFMYWIIEKMAWLTFSYHLTIFSHEKSINEYIWYLSIIHLQ